MQTPNMQFILTGFSEVAGFRVFAFEGIAADWTRTAFTVRTNLALTRRYGIRLQELPLLCRAVLECREGEVQRAFTFTEGDMRLHADRVAARGEAARQRKSPRQRPTSRVGAAWRSPQP